MANLIFDGNYILHKNVGSLHKMNRLYGDLWTCLDNNISKYVSMSKWDNIFIVSDSRKKSWRKDQLDAYKGKRKPLDGVDMAWVYEQYALWKAEKSEKYNVIERDRVEGDDWIASIILKSNKMGQSNVVISSDGDMPQLLGYKLNGDKSWINIQINDHSGKENVYVPIGWELWAKEFENNRSNDIFNLDNSGEWLNFFNRVTKQWQYTEINPMERLFVKLVEGDKSDNINSIYESLTKTGKIQGIGKAGAKKIWDFYKDNYKDYFSTKDNALPDEMINCIERVKGIIMSDERKDVVRTNLKRNIKLIELHYRHFPDWIVEQIIDELNEKV
jgi:5'-3' exonuclease